MVAATDQQPDELAALRQQREALHRELVRKTYRIGELEQEIAEVARTYEESLSWRLTRPVRGLKPIAEETPPLAMRRDLRVLKTILPAWAIAFLRRLRGFARRGKQLRLHTPRARREAALQELDVLPTRPLISLVMPTYKTDPKYLCEAVDSVRSQYYPEWELIVVDDGSEVVALEQTMSSYGGDPRIKFKPLRENVGISAATNAGLELCEGEFVGFLDHDDTLTPDALLRVAQRSPPIPSSTSSTPTATS